MRICKDKKAHRYQMVVCAQNKGIKPCARAYNTSPKVVRKWVRRFGKDGYPGLEDRSRRPHRMPNATPDKEKQEIIEMRAKYKRLGAEQVKIIEDLDRSAKTIRKIWREAGKSRKRRTKKYITKQNLREVKKNYRLFEYSCEDTKELKDIPEYWPQMMRRGLPKHQYTYREVSCGIQFLGYADDLSLTHSTVFAQYVNAHLRRYGLSPDESTRQTDNGSEYIGAWNAKHSSSYTKEIQSIKGQLHRTIPPRAYKQQGDVETVHNLIEQEFFELETFKDRLDFFERSYSYLLFFNFERPNTYKEGKSPWQLAKEKNPELKKEALILPPIDLDAAVNNLALGGNYVLTNP
jgi:transposase